MRNYKYGSVLPGKKPVTRTITKNGGTESILHSVSSIYSKESLIKYCVWISKRIFLSRKEEEEAYIAAYKRLTMTMRGGKRPRKIYARLYSAIP
jgi:hypothetical protein